MQQSKRTFTYTNGNAIEFTFDSRHQELYDIITNFRMSSLEFERRLTSEPEILHSNIFMSGSVVITPFYLAVVVGNIAALNGIVDNMYRTLTLNKSMLLGAIDLALLFDQEQALAALMKHPSLFFEWDCCGINGKAYKELVKMTEGERLSFFGGDEKLIGIYKGFDRVFKEHNDPDKEAKFLMNHCRGLCRTCVSLFFTIVGTTYLVTTVSQIMLDTISAQIHGDIHLSHGIFNTNSSMGR